MMSMQKAHSLCEITGAMCTAVTVTPGSIVKQGLAKNADTKFILMEYPTGILKV